jgi:hypothetical protein
MAKLEIPHEDIRDLFNEVISESMLDNYLNITVLADNKSKDVTKISKCSPSEKLKTGDDVNIFVNELIFDQLTPPLQRMVIDEALAGISFDTEHDKLVIKRPDVLTFSGMLQKYTFEELTVLKESIKAILSNKAEQADATKATV